MTELNTFSDDVLLSKAMLAVLVVWCNNRETYKIARRTPNIHRTQIYVMMTQVAACQLSRRSLFPPLHQEMADLITKSGLHINGGFESRLCFEMYLSRGESRAGIFKQSMGLGTE